MNLIIALTLALATLFAPATASQPTQPTLTASQPSTTATLPDVLTVHCEEDQPCWDCQTMGNRICGPTEAQYVTEAGSLLKAQPVNLDAYEYVFEGAYDHDAATGTEFSLTSKLYPNTFYLFSVNAYPTTQPSTTAPTAYPTVATAQPTVPALPAQPTITASVKAQPATITAQPTKATAQPTTAPTAQPTQPTATATAPTAQPAKGSTADTVKSCDIKPGQAWAGYSQYCLGK